MYHIVSFVDTDEVEVVPAIWVKKDVCVWPPYKGKGIQRATKYLEQPHESWSAYKVKILYTAKNYSEARRKLPLAEQQTDLQSEAESDSLRPPKRKIKRNRRLMDEYDTEEEEATAPIKNNLPQAPQIHPLSNRICSASNELQPSPQGQRQNHPSVSHQKSPDVAQIPETSRPSLLEISPASERHERTLGPALRQAIDLPEPSLLLHQTSQQPWQVRNFARKSQDITEHHSELMWQQDTPLQSPGQEMQSLWHHETPRPQRKSLSSDDRLIRSLLHDIVSKQEILMEQQRNIIRMVQDIKANNVQEITETQNQSPKQFPIEDLRSLTSLENDLRSCPVTRQKVVLELGLLGGVDVKDTVWRIMRQAIKNDFAKVVNWRGVHGKTPFQSLQLRNIVIEAVRRNPVCAQTTELEVEKVIKRWFHLAGDREGGRKRSTPLQNVNVNHTF